MANGNFENGKRGIGIKYGLANVDPKILRHSTPAGSSQIGNYFLHSQEMDVLTRSFAVEITDESLASLDIHVADIVIAVEFKKPILNRMMVARFGSASSMRRLRVLEVVRCDCVGSLGGFHLTTPDHVSEIYCSHATPIEVVGLVTKLDKRSASEDLLSIEWNGSERHVFWTAAADGKLVTNLDGFRLLDGFGLREGSLLDDFWSILHPDDVERTIRAWDKSVRTGEPYATEYRIRSPFGDYLDVIASAVPLRFQNRVIKWSGILRISKPMALNNSQTPQKGGKTETFGLIG